MRFRNQKMFPWLRPVCPASRPVKLQPWAGIRLLLFAGFSPFHYHLPMQSFNLRGCCFSLKNKMLL